MYIYLRFRIYVKEILKKIDRDYNNSAELKDSYIKEIFDKINTLAWFLLVIFKIYTKIYFKRIRKI